MAALREPSLKRCMDLFTGENTPQSWAGAREYNGWRHSLGSAFLEAYVYLSQPRGDYDGTQGAFIEKVYISPRGVRLV